MKRRIKCEKCEDTYACIKDVGIGSQIYYKYKCKEKQCDDNCPTKKETRGLCYSCRRFEGMGVA